MKIPPHHLAVLAALVLPGLGSLSTCRGATPYHFLKEIPIPGKGGWDYLSIDSSARRLYVSHSTQIVVLDIDSNSIVGQISDTPGVHGFAIAPKLDRGFSSNGKESKVSIVDLKTLQTLSKVDTGTNPDAILYNPSRNEVYAFNGRSASSTAIDASSGKVIATIPLDGKPEFAQVDPAAGLVYDNLEDKSLVAVIDAKSHQVVNRWPIAPGEAASGMAIDLAHHRLFLGCDNKLMVMLDSSTGRVITSVPIEGGVDANAFDPDTQLAFSSNGEGTVTIAHEDSPEKLTVVQTLKTEKGARTMALDPTTHRIYLATAKFEDTPTPAPGAPHQRPKVIPGTFKILIYTSEPEAKK